MNPFSRASRRISVIAATLLLSATAGISGEPSRMEGKIAQVDGFTVIGVSARTNNAKEMTPDGVIGKQWARLMQEDLLSKISNKVDKNIVAIYTDYASDNNGEYTFVLGAKVNPGAEIPAGMVMKKIPAGRYAMFPSTKAPPPN